MDNDLINLVYKYAIVPMSIVFWWLFKKIDYRLEKTELANTTIQKEFELRLQTMEKALEIRVQNLEKANVAIVSKLDAIKETLGDIKEAQKAIVDSLTNKIKK